MADENTNEDAFEEGTEEDTQLEAAADALEAEQNEQPGWWRWRKAAADERRPATARHPSKKACATHSLLSVATLAVIMVVSCRDRYPFKAQNRCSPCECEGSVLTSCKLANVALSLIHI